MSDEFATKLIALRVKNDLTQQQLAEAVGISSSQISRYESGLAMPRKTVMLKLAKALSVTTDELLESDDDQSMQARLEKGSRNLQNLFVEALQQLTPEQLKEYEDGAEAVGMPVSDYMLKVVEGRFMELATSLAKEGDMRGANEIRIISSAIFNRLFDLPAKE